MGRPRKYHVDPDELLADIKSAYEADVAELEAQHEKDPYGYSSWAREARWELTRATEVGVKVDFARFAGHGLTAGERMRYQEALRLLEQRELVAIYGERATRLKLTPEGVAYLTNKEAMNVHAQNNAEPAGGRGGKPCG